MIYTEESHITSVEEVTQFFKFLIEEKRLNFHPDDDFAEYVYNETQEPFFNEAEVKLYNRLMDECFAVCAESNYSIYEIGLEILKENIR